MSLAYLTRTVVQKRLVRTGSTKRIVRERLEKRLAKYTGPSVTITVGQASVEFLGSTMTGADGATSRTYTHTTSFSGSAKVYVGSPNGTMRLPSSKWSLSTVTVQNDTISVNVPIYNEDQVIVDT